MAAERLAEAEDPIRVYAWICNQPIVCRIDDRPNRSLGRRCG
jgi:hypothetical protein